MSTTAPHEWKVTVLYRSNVTGRNDSAVYHVTGPNEGGARSWGRLRFIEDHAAQIEAGSLTFLCSMAERHAEQLELL